ncbi:MULTISPECIES: hypothetical protein [Cyanophyceae]|uniref:hypothetical protein n=1 Tax=Cyanophyceae TaxID=3028117 RepID=UPI00168876F0|nr:MULTISPECIES: hypothetical protein [Cyanophyceae]MBD1918904.1 hypothetical protein [Phormidium sp. FACHB-77]MBD2033254.1 hypothetical protein [Phormidium sp. FACHB-322]MBD2053813.1 hypothetical protein [Leptolyngbya sp. FACHB-60]
MQPKRRHEILAVVGHQNLLPQRTSAREVQELSGLIESIGWPRYQLTPTGWNAIQLVGQQALARKKAS